MYIAVQQLTPVSSVNRRLHLPQETAKQPRIIIN
jgi:hypothetical protein